MPIYHAVRTNLEAFETIQATASEADLTQEIEKSPEYLAGSQHLAGLVTELQELLKEPCEVTNLNYQEVLKCKRS